MIIQYFRKMGGFSLLKSWAYNRVLFYTVGLFLVLPKNRFGLEILSECIEKKIYTHLKRKFKKTINQQRNMPIDIQRKKIIWFCWLQGIESAPELVKINYGRLHKFFLDYEINIITSENFRNFTNIPDFIIKKWKTGIITHTHFSDILRTNLLALNGGIWIDATVFVTNVLPDDIAESCFFLFRTQKPGVAGKCITVSSWFISSVAAHPVMLLVQEMIFDYWSKHNYLCDYFLFHLCLEIALEKYADLISDMPKYTNETPHFLLYELSHPYDSNNFKSIIRKSFVHKLTNKMSEKEQNAVGTVYQYLLKGQNTNV